MPLHRTVTQLPSSHGNCNATCKQHMLFSKEAASTAGYYLAKGYCNAWSTPSPTFNHPHPKTWDRQVSFHNCNHCLMHHLPGHNCLNTRTHQAFPHHSHSPPPSTGYWVDWPVPGCYLQEGHKQRKREYGTSHGMADDSCRHTRLLQHLNHTAKKAVIVNACGYATAS